MAVFVGLHEESMCLLYDSLFHLSTNITTELMIVDNRNFFSSKVLVYLGEGV